AAIAPPVAGFQSSDSAFCANGCVNFTDTSTNAPTSWLWTFQGGTPASSTDQNPFVCYLTGGTFNVKLVASNSGGSDSVITSNSFIIVYSAPPIPTITISYD